MNLSNVNFGDRVAENESRQLASYFIKTDDWEQLRTGKVDIVFGAKGAGKSALYTLLVQNEALLLKDGVHLV
jgi:hypothetical protein